ncbi:MAG: hypothetical protein A3J38_01410 [Gammaproteobacteria bacterium RIFCSPHIGHO2_12_FULL_45_9]|nr:MAG: hypothetical protein A3J38_01410 [Gammaproteobacteria bacterium RIFCSPHIGHO2_12_FULL_45_9]
MQANTVHVPLLCQGFVQESAQKTHSFVMQIGAHTPTLNGMMIDPLAFEAYHIDQVPAVVVTTGSSLCREGRCHPEFQVVYGDGGLPAAFFAVQKAENSALRAIATQLLSRMGYDHEK